jgi:hypothetical protein
MSDVRRTMSMALLSDRYESKTAVIFGKIAAVWLSAVFAIFYVV